MAAAPLSGVRIIAVEQFGAGPFGTLHLADLGADVIRVEDPTTGGDVSRYVSPGQQGTDSLYFDSFNRGKRSILLDLKQAAGQEVLQRLVGSAHAVYANLRGDVIKGLGLTYATLGPINPAIVCVSLSAYGRDGDRSSEPGYDPLIQAEAGWAALTGDPDGPPVKSGLSLADYAGGVMAALALMAAVFDAQRKNREPLVAILADQFRRQPTEHWVRLLRGKVPVAPVRSMEAALDLKELREWAMLASYRHAALGEVTTVGLPIKMGGFAPTYRPAPRLDGDRTAVLTEAGYQPDEIDGLASRG